MDYLAGARSCEVEHLYLSRHAFPQENPYFVPLCSGRAPDFFLSATSCAPGAFAGVASETLLFPLDCP